MRTTEVVVVGAGHAGLAMSRCLADRGVDHVVIERGRLGERWRTARWDSFRLLTPNWLTRLPGWQYRGDDPDGFMTAGQFVSYLDGYARWSGLPVQERTTVTGLRSVAGGYLVSTDRGEWSAPAVVIATGYYASARRPAGVGQLAPQLTQLSAAGYRRPGQLPDGGVLVVGAAASGVQIADELARSGRPVVLSVGSHTRLPRRYRDRDILWWLSQTGALDRTIDELPERAQREPSMQLVGGQEQLDLAVLQERGVRLAGRLRAVEDHAAWFDDDLAVTTADADARLRRVLARIDRYAAAAGEPVTPAEPLPPTLPPARPPRQLALAREGITSVVWATGFRPWYPWLQVPVLDPTGRLKHRRGVTDAPGLYAIGLRFQHRRNATFIDGARHDAAYLTDQLLANRAAHRVAG